MSAKPAAELSFSIVAMVKIDFMSNISKPLTDTTMISMTVK